MKIFYFLPLLVVLTACLISCNNDEVVPNVDQRPVRSVAGADTNTIKISDTESFNLNNFLVCFEQIAFEGYFELGSFKHNIIGNNVQGSTFNYKFRGNNNKIWKDYTHHYNLNGLIDSTTWNYVDSYYTLIYDYDNQGMITQYRWSRIDLLDGSVSKKSYTRSCVYDEYKNLVELIENEKHLPREFDEKNRLIKRYVNSDGGYLTYSYSNGYLDIVEQYQYDLFWVKWDYDIDATGKMIREFKLVDYNRDNSVLGKEIIEYEYPGDTLVVFHNDFSSNDNGHTGEYWLTSKKYYLLNYGLVRHQSYVNSISNQNKNTYVIDEFYFDKSGSEVNEAYVYESENTSDYISYGVVETYQEIYKEYSEMVMLYDSNQNLLNEIHYHPHDPNSMMKYDVYNSEGIIINDYPVWLQSLASKLYYRY
ncbi:hypothetical protein OO013_06460 [Mangrovivirga sp. M17]|uniref:YD repeat-containing protein n=1 Tax=Mangrovivirga halotolerans TaxID=2993936 RepID=A0ABT3RQ48_9BACT|nr:hypothetical protein [Mangrovivirga halotolerans]MCX2743499.1 hypothetical protein [Mangrovivirga halotolerans]